MKKLFFYFSIFAAMTMVMVSCSKDDNDDTDSQENRLRFANKLTQDGLVGEWEGMDQLVRRDGAESGQQNYAVMRFERTSKDATEGKGYVLYFKNSFKTELSNSSEIKWYFANDQLKIDYSNGWDTRYAEYRTSELNISDNTFSGRWFERNDYYWLFSYTKTTFNEWDKYIKKNQE